MLHFLLNRPIAVTMTLLAVLILGAVAVTMIPVSLMPDVDIPRVTVQVSANNTSARQLENAVVAPLRRHLVQVAHVSDIRSETRDEKSIINLSFDYGTDTDFAFIEVNEKIDRAMASHPRDIPRPRVIKASATDVPVYYLNLTLKESSPGQIHTAGTTDPLFPVPQKFVELSGFADQVIRKRLEQLPEVALADVSGLVFPELLVLPDLPKLRSLNITLEQLEGIMRAGNVNFGNLLIRDGHYQYNVRFNTALRDKRDIEDLYLNIDGRLLQIKDIANVVEHPQERKGLVTHNRQDAVTIAIIKQSDARMGTLKDKLNALALQFNADYPDINFVITRDQTRLLDYSISNLTENLVWGGVLAFAVMFLFLKDFRSPLLIGISMPASLIVSLILFYLLDISVNIISLSGLVLGLGMMVDNSIIVIDNITQHRERGAAIVPACLSGTHEVFSPMLSAMLTSCAVFIPLIFLSGIAGALFYDQALAVVIGHFASLLISVTLIPVYYRIMYRRDTASGTNRWLSRINILDYGALYEKTFRWVMRHQRTVWSIVTVLLIVGAFLFTRLPRSELPPVTTREVLLAIDWNETINPTENQKRTHALIAATASHTQEATALVGEQQFLLARSEAGPAESTLYFQAKTPEDLAQLIHKAEEYLIHQHTGAVFEFREAENFFNLIFPESDPPLVARLRPTGDFGDRHSTFLQDAIAEIQRRVPDRQIDPIPWQESLTLRANPVELMAYDIAPETLYKQLSVAFRQSEVLLLANNQHFVPVILGEKSRSIDEVLKETRVANKEGSLFPVRELVSTERTRELKTITAGPEGEYFPVDLQAERTEVNAVMATLKQTFRDNRFFEVDFSGSHFSDSVLIRGLVIILLVALALLYFILAAQFESLILPLVVLIEIPLGIAGALLFLNLFDAGINLMSLIGIVVMTGIIINDSILKLDTTNQLLREGYSLIHALLVTGQRRLKPILMTSLTTVLAMSPLLFSSGLGAELQRPLAIALTGGMVIGTLVSLYFIPLCYYYIRKGSTSLVSKSRS